MDDISRSGDHVCVSLKVGGLRCLFRYLSEVQCQPGSKNTGCQETTWAHPHL